MYVYVVYDLTSCVIVDELLDFIPTLSDAEWGNAWHFLEIPSFGKQLEQMHPFSSFSNSDVKSWRQTFIEIYS